MIINDNKMKTKKRTINTEANIYKKKINTRNMHSRNSNESNMSSGNNVSSTRSKHSPNTRAKTNCVIKSHSDPYAFSKIDDEDKIPLKRIKVTEKIGKEIGVNTSNLATMTEPEYLGPCEPGTSIELQGIVWLETATGLLVINVTWRGRTYVGTLMDSTKYEFTPSLSQENLGKFEGRPSNRSTRGKKRQVGNPGNHFSLRSNNIRHSRRLSESMNASNTDGMIKKLSTRQTNNLINYFDSTNQSATASASGDSDTDKNSYSKFSTSSKTRSVTRSITKLNKTALCDYNSNSIDDNNINLIPCSKENCFKRFVDLTAFQYHIQRCHNNSSKENNVDDIVHDNNSLLDDNNRNNSIKIEPTNNENEKYSTLIDSNTQENATVKTSKLNGIINKEINNKMNNFEFNFDSETEKCQNKLSYNYIENKGDLKIPEKECIDQKNDMKPFIKSESVSPQFQELSVTLPKVSENVIVSSDILLPTTCSIRETFSCNSEDRLSAMTIESIAPVSKSTLSTLKNLSQSVSDFTSSTTVISHSSPSIRTVTAPTVSIPVELINTSNNFTNSTISCPTLIRPKPNQNPVGSANHSSQNRKFKSTKSSSQTNGATESFQIPSSTPVIIKKRPLVPLKVSVNQNTNANVNRVYPITSHLNVSSPNSSSRHIRSSSISPVTPILPATSTAISSTSSITGTSSISGQSVTNSLNNMYHNGQLPVRRTSVTTNITSTSGLSTLGSLKPIQPKPKSSQFSSTVTTSHLGINTSPYPVSQSIIVPSISGISNIHISHQRQILPSPISKSDCSASIDENLIHKIESLKNSSLKRKRRKPEKKIRLNFHESNRYKKFTLNPIQPKHITNEHFPSKLNSDEFCISSEKYKTDEENSHSPGYSDLSETNDTPAPILEKEIDLKTGDCDKLVICTDFDRISSYRHNSSSSENYDDPKDLSNKPPALMPAVLSSDLVNGSTNELDYRDIKPRASRKKPLTSKRAHKVKDISKGKLNSEKSVGSDWINVSASKKSAVPQSSNRKSFQLSSSGIQQTLSSVPITTSQSQILSPLPNNEFPSTDSNKFVSINRNLIPSAINDYSRTNKANGENSKNNQANKQLDSTFQSNHVTSEDNGKTRSKSSKSPSNNNSGKFSVQALTSPQDLVSRSLSFATSSTVPSIIPNNKLSKN